MVFHMTFETTESLKNYILSKINIAIQETQERVYEIIHKFVKQYYAEYSPSIYERTYQLFNSLVKSEIKESGNGYIAEIYFDIGLLDYHMKRIHGIEVSNKGWSEEKTLSAAAHGSHGGWVSGTAIWDEPLEKLNAEAYEILKQMLIDAGIPLR